MSGTRPFVRVVVAAFGMAVALAHLHGAPFQTSSASLSSAGIAGAAAIPPTPAVNPATHRTFVPLPDGRVLVTNSSNAEPVARIVVSGRAIDVVVNPITNVAFALSENGVVSVIDGVSNRVASTIALGQSGMSIGINTITNRIYVGTVAGLVVVDADSGHTIATLTGVFANPDIVVNEATNRVYASSIAENRVTVLDGFSNAVIASVPVGDRPAGLAIDPSINRVYVANSGASVGTITAIDGFRHTVVGVIPVGASHPVGVSVDVRTGNVSATMSSGAPVVIDMITVESLSSSPSASLTAARQAASTSDVSISRAAAGPIANAAPAVSVPGAAVFNVRLATDAVPDLTDLQSLVSSATSLWTTPQEKVWALFYWSHILKRQTGPVVLHGFEVTDPIKNFADYGFTMCSTITGINQTLYEAIGLRHQYWDICNHTVSAVEYDGKFHMVDSSMSNLVTLDDGVTLASVQEAAANAARLVRDRSLYATSAEGFLTGTDTIRSLPDAVNPVTGSVNSGFYRAFCESNLRYRDYYYNWNAGHRYVLNLREGESYTRYFRQLDTTSQYWVGSEHIDAPDPANTFENDAPNKFGLRGNGTWSFSPALSSDGWAAAAYRHTNVTPAEAGGLRPAVAGAASELVYKVQAANAMSGQHIDAEFARTDALATAAIDISVNHGTTWTTVGTVGDALGLVAVPIDLRDEVNAAYEMLLRIRMTTDSATPDGISLTGLSIDTITQVNTKALPRLNIGRNEIYIDAGDQSDTMVLWPELRADLWSKDVYDSSNIASQPVSVPRTYTSIVYPSVFSQDAYLTYRMDAPTDITRVVYGGRLFNASSGSYIDFLHSFDNGATWTRSYRLTDVARPNDVIHYETVTAIPPGTRTVLFKYVFHTTATTASKASGLYSTRMEVDHQPATAAPAPLDVTFRWKEVKSDRTTVARSHKQLVTEFPFKYVIDVGGSDHPVMDSITLNVAAEDDGSPQGYSDGVDAGGTRYLYSRRTDGTNVAQSKPYTVSRAPSGFQNSAPPTNTTILTDGVVGAPGTGGFAYWLGQCWSGQPVDLQVDLGVPQSVGAMRAHLFGYPGWDALKGQVLDTVEVLTSLDGVAFASQGFLQTSLWRKNIPINHMLQDDEKATAWNFELLLPVPTVARYVRYHVTPKRTLCASELQVFDHVDYTPFDIRIAPPPGMAGGPGNIPPSVTLTAPAGGSQFLSPASVDLSAEAVDPDGTIQQVDFFAGSTLVGTATASPFAVTWTDAPEGSYTLTARALDNSGAMTTSLPVHVTVTDPNSLVNVPDVTGMTQATAAATLAAANLAVGQTTTATSATVAAGSVISQTPVAGVAVVRGSAVALVVSSGPPPAQLPAPWTAQDVGMVGRPGTTSYDSGSGTFTVIGAGADIWGSADAFRYVYQPFNGDGDIVARVVTVQNTNAWVKAGVMVRENLTAGAAQAMMMVTPSKGNNFQRRPAAGGATLSTAGAMVAAPYWVKLSRTGATITAYQSADGSTWAVVGSQTMTLPSSVFIGLAVSSHSASTLATATFDNVSVTNAPATVLVPDVVGFTQVNATSALAAAGLDVGSTSAVASDSVPAGNVVSQMPSAGTSVVVGSAVALTISSGPATVVVPDVSGLTQSAATTVITAASLAVGSVTTITSTSVPAGNVVSQSPAAGATVPHGSPISLVVSVGPPPTGIPTPWQTQDIGAVGVAGNASYASATSTFAVAGAGADIWGSTDALRYVYQPLSGDGQIVARVASVQNTNVWVKAGVMIRANLTPGSPQAMMMVTPGKGNNFQRRLTAGGSSVGTAGASVTAPYWVKLTRAGTLISAYQSPDGTTWSTVGTATISLPTDVLVGLAVSSHSTSALATGTFDQVMVTSTGGPAPTLPTPWVSQDVGAVGRTGSAAFDAPASTFSVAGAGADIWGSADAFRYVYQSLDGDGQIVARVVSEEYVHAWLKAGVMIRTDLTPGSAQAMMMVTPGKGNNFQRRPVAGGASVSTVGSAVTAPYWVKLTRQGSTITAYESLDGTSWTLVDTATIAMPDSVLIGLAVSSHIAGTLANVSFDQVTVGAVAPE